MVAIIWEYHIEPTMQRAFEQYYHPQGRWARCFQQHPDYIETRLLQDATDKHRYLTIDYWRGAASFDQFYQQHHGEYDQIDAMCQAFTHSETRIGIFAESAIPGAPVSADDEATSTRRPPS